MATMPEFVTDEQAIALERRMSNVSNLLQFISNVTKLRSEIWMQYWINYFYHGHPLHHSPPYLDWEAAIGLVRASRTHFSTPVNIWSRSLTDMNALVLLSVVHGSAVDRPISLSQLHQQRHRGIHFLWEEGRLVLMSRTQKSHLTARQVDLVHKRIVQTLRTVQQPPEEVGVEVRRSERIRAHLSSSLCSNEKTSPCGPNVTLGTHHDWLAVITSSIHGKGCSTSVQLPATTVLAHISLASFCPSTPQVPDSPLLYSGLVNIHMCDMIGSPLSYLNDGMSTLLNNLSVVYHGECVGEEYIAIIANRNIQPAEELCIEYGDLFWKSSKWSMQILKKADAYYGKTTPEMWSALLSAARRAGSKTLPSAVHRAHFYLWMNGDMGTILYIVRVAGWNVRSSQWRLLMSTACSHPYTGNM